MVSHLFFYQLTLIALVWLCVMLQWAWPSDSAAACPSPLDPTPPRLKRKRAPKRFAGLTTQPPHIPSEKVFQSCGFHIRLRPQTHID